MCFSISLRKCPLPLVSLLSLLILTSCSSTKTPKQAVKAKAAASQADEKLPRENVIDVPAMSAGLSVSNLFQSHMVLQRDKPIVIWGWAKPGEKITATFAGETKSVTAEADRSWKLRFKSQSANANGQKMVIKGARKTLVLTDILIGDVWVLGGQSNMEFPISRVEGGALEIASANYPQIRLMTIPTAEGPEEKKSFPRLMEWSSWHKQHYKKGYWEACTPESVYEFSAIGYIFGRRIHKALKVPIGLVDISRGGTTVEAWTPDAVLRKIDNEQVKEKLAAWDKRVGDWDGKKDLEERIAKHEAWLNRMKEAGKKVPDNRKQPPSDLRPSPAVDKNRPGNLYSGMLAPIKGLAVKGALFHQGYNNAGEGSWGGKMYRAIFPEMIKAWRGAFNDDKLAFGILAFCSSGYPQTVDNFTGNMFTGAPFIREAQYQTFLQFYKAGDKNVGFVSTYNLRRRWYHPQLKVPAGERIARWALATQYGFDKLLWKPPMIEAMTVEQGKIILKLDSPVGNNADGRYEGFAIAGKDGIFYPAHAEHPIVGKDRRGRPRGDRQALALSSPMVPDPLHYRYAWASNPMGNIQVTQGRQPPFTDCYLATQRSDTWDLEDMTDAILGEKVGRNLTRAQRIKVITALHEQDKNRKLKEAELLLKEAKEKTNEATEK